MFPLGRFDLHGPAGRGGMAVVWRATHRAQGVPVAVKVLDGQGVRDPVFLASFRDETRITAGLDHPAVIRIFDHGEVDAEQARASRGALVEGSPYLVMEWGSGGVLRPHLPSRSWPELRAILEVLLDALAHAHARHIVHRDLKPSNVVLCTGEDLRPGLKLADFGIARPLGAPGTEEDAVAGTPHYMAPEQIYGDARELGPWTDLYALGCVAFLGATGATPFHGPTEKILDAHLDADVPRLEPRFDVPLGLEDWMRTLLEKKPSRRFRRAADAARELRALGPACAGATSVALSQPSYEPTTVTPPEDLPTLAALDGSVRAPSSRPAAPSAGARGLTLVADWRAREAPIVPRLAGVGLALWGLRPVPMIGREAERDAIWGALRDVAWSGRARAIVLRGPTGTGKSRLAEWTCLRAHELGAATPIRVEHGATAGPTQGIAPALARHLRAEDRPPDELPTHLARALEMGGPGSLLECARLASLLVPDAESTRELRPAERHARLRSTLERIARERPLVVAIDDGAWAHDSIELARHVLDAQDGSSSPILFVIATGQDALSERPLEQRALARLLESDAATAIDIGPLSERDHLALVRQLLGLDESLATTIAARTMGNPLFAVQLVGDWVERGALEPHRRGFRLRPGTKIDLPESVAEVWDIRVERVLEGAGEETRCGIEIAAALGQQVDGHEWREACARAGVAPPLEWIERLLREQLIVAGERGVRAGFRFVHGMLRETIVRRAQPRAPAIHRACAAMLASIERSDERVGRHLVAAGDVREGIDALARAVIARLRANDNAVASALVDELDAAIEQAGERGDPEARGLSRAFRATLVLREGSWDEGTWLAERAEADARTHGWDRTLLTLVPTLLRLPTRELSESRRDALMSDAERIAARLGDSLALAEARYALGDAERRAGRNESAVRASQDSLKLYRALGLELGEGRSLLGVGLTLRNAGRSAEAITWYERGLEIVERTGSTHWTASASNALADTLRDVGRAAEAEPLYRRAHALFESMGSPDARIIELNLGVLALASGRPCDARAVYERCRRAVGARMPLVRASAEIGLAGCAALEGRWDELDERLARIEVSLESAGFADPDNALVLRLAGDTARDAARIDEARVAYRLAAGEWRRLGRPDAAAELDELARA